MTKTQRSVFKYMSQFEQTDVLRILNKPHVINFNAVGVFVAWTNLANISVERGIHKNFHNYYSIVQKVMALFSHIEIYA